MTARRLAYLYDMADVDVDSADDLYPFRDDHLASLNNVRSRDALDYLRRHHLRCITAGRWEEPGLMVRTPVSSQENELDPLWNDFHSAFQANVPDGEEELAHVLADAIGAIAPELSEGFHFSCTPDARYVEVEAHKPDNSVDKRLVAVCNARLVVRRSASKSLNSRPAPVRFRSRSFAPPTSRGPARRSRRLPAC